MPEPRRNHQSAELKIADGSDGVFVQRERQARRRCKKVFAQYRELPKTERPKTDDDKRDQWLVRYSRASGKNLGPFFEAWGVPTTDSARKSIADLPGWMPADWPKL